MGIEDGGQNYLYNGKELQDETGWYDYGWRMYDPEIGRFMVVDPAIENGHFDYTPYAYVYNNPINLIDPLGLDSIRVNNGVVSSVSSNDDPNRYYDASGNELFFHDVSSNDPEDEDAGVDDLMLEADLEKGDRVFFPISENKYTKAIDDAGIDPERGPVSTADKSHSDADFAENYLAKESKAFNGGTSDSRRCTYNSQSAYFKFDGDNTVYNLYDAGNHMWGNWMRKNGWSEKGAKRGANANELFMDSNADQRAISKGWHYGLKKKKE